MDKSVRRVTLVQGSGDNRVSKVVYDAVDDDESTPGKPDFSKLERSVRHMLKAQVIAAQEAYQHHLDSAAKEGNEWLFDAPSNFLKARKKAMKEMRKSMPFGKNDDDKED
jgi:hypothetical protein